MFYTMNSLRLRYWWSEAPENFPEVLRSHGKGAFWEDTKRRKKQLFEIKNEQMIEQLISSIDSDKVICLNE